MAPWNGPNNSRHAQAAEQGKTQPLPPQSGDWGVKTLTPSTAYEGMSFLLSPNSIVCISQISVTLTVIGDNHRSAADINVPLLSSESVVVAVPFTTGKMGQFSC